MLLPAVDETGVRRCEIDHLINHEFVVHLQNFLRRLSKIELLYSPEILRESKGLREVCNRLFGEQAETRWQEYFDQENKE